MGCSKSSSKSVVYSYTDLPQETRKTLNKQPNLPSKGIRKTINKAQSQQKDKNSKDQKGSKQNRNQKQQKRSMKPRAIF